MYLCTLARRYADGYKKPLAIILVSVNDHKYWLLHTVALGRPIRIYQVWKSHFNCLLFWDTLILLLVCVLILRILIPSHFELFLNKIRNGVRITLQTRHWIPNSCVNSTAIMHVQWKYSIVFYSTLSISKKKPWFWRVGTGVKFNYHTPIWFFTNFEINST